MFSFNLLFLVFLISQLDQTIGWKKPIINETKILENIDNYDRLVRQMLNANLNSKNSKDTKESNVQPKIFPRLLNSSRAAANPKLLVLALDGFR